MYESIGGINDEMTNTGKDMERLRDKVGTAEAALTSSKNKIHRLVYKIDGIREWYKESKDDWRDAVYRAKDATGMDRYKTERQRNILYQEEVLKNGIINETYEVWGRFMASGRHQKRG